METKNNEELYTKLINYFEKIKKENQINNLNSKITDVNKFIEDSHNIINEYFDYQKYFYQLMNDEIKDNKHLSNLYKQVFDNYLLMKQKENYINSIKNGFQIDEDFNIKNKNKEYDTLDELINIKTTENNINKDLFNITIQDSDKDIDKQLFINSYENKSILLKTIKDLFKDKGESIFTLLNNNLTKDEENLLKKINCIPSITNKSLDIQTNENKKNIKSNSIDLKGESKKNNDINKINQKKIKRKK